MARTVGIGCQDCDRREVSAASLAIESYSLYRRLKNRGGTINRKDIV